ncbi:MAG TPA: oxidoreductase [Solibacterales bacterium]|nr:oxidoreductase [Bryobacterales bacterium]
MKPHSRRRWIAAAGGFAGLAAASKIAGRYGLIPPDSGGLYGPGATLTYAAHKLLAGGAMAREFSRDQISTAPFANGQPLDTDEFKRHQAANFETWRLSVDGLVSRPVHLTLGDLRAFPARSHITQLVCEEGWSFIAEWTGAALGDVLRHAGLLPQAKYIVYSSLDPNWWDSVDIDEAGHPQTLLTYGMNGGVLPVGHGGPLRLRVPRQLGYKSVKYVTRLTATDDIAKFGKGLGSAAPEFGYAWYAGI